MSIVDIEQSKTLSNSKGIEKSVDANALSLILDNVQISQYVFPEASTVRELTSNAVDSQKEKEKAIEILTGKAKVEDYYIKRDDSKYSDSDFNPEYYNIDKLNKTDNKVYLKYIIGSEGVGWCDKFVVRDNGVGLGDKRLYGYFQIGYSSKRNTVSQLGGFGLGAKVGLSLRNDYYTTETVHNGRRFKFNCYSYKVDSLVPKFNLDTNEENGHIVFPDGNIVYYEKTDNLNYTQVTVPCKSHHRDKFRHAIESQLLYFDNVEFSIISADGREDKRDIQARVLYNSENLIIADQYQYSKPHIIVVKDKNSPVGVSYGYVNFREMEMQDLFGNVGFKCPIRQVIRDAKGQEVVLQEGIEVTPSRESVIWSDATRDYVKKAIEKASTEANSIIESQLNEDDFLVWIDKAKNILGNIGGHNSNPTLRHLSNIIDKTQLSPLFKGDNTIKYTNPKVLFWGLNVRSNFKHHDWKAKKDEIRRDEIAYWDAFNPNLCYLQEGSTSLVKDFYINEKFGSFTTIRILDDETLYSYIKEDEYDEHGKLVPNKWTKDYIDSLKAKRDTIVDFIKKSKLFKSYDDLQIPDDWNKKFEEKFKADEEAGEEAKIEKLTPAELRKLQEKTVVHYLEEDFFRKDKLPFTWKKHEVSIQELKDDESTVYYSYGDDNSIPMTTCILYKMMGSQVSRPSHDFKLIRVSKSMPKKFLKKHKHINSFYKQSSDKQIGMSKQLTDWITAKLIHDNMESLKFLRNYKLFNFDISNLYDEIKSFKEDNFHEDYIKHLTKYGEGEKFITDVLSYTSKVTELQLFIREHKDSPDEIKNKSLELFGIDTYEQAIGYNLEMYDKLQTLLNYAEPVKALFNHIDILKDQTKPSISQETEILIKEVIQSKGLNDFKIPDFKVDNVVEIEETDKVEELVETDDNKFVLSE